MGLNLNAVIVVIAHNDISVVVEIAELRKLEFVEESSLYRDPGPLTCRHDGGKDQIRRSCRGRLKS